MARRAALQVSAEAYGVRHDYHTTMQFGGTVVYVDYVSLNAGL